MAIGRMQMAKEMVGNKAKPSPKKPKKTPNPRKG